MKTRNIMLSAAFFAASFFTPNLYAAPIAGEPPIEVRFIGYEKEQPIFLVNISNPDEDVLMISIRFDNGDLLYADKIKEKSYTQRFRMNIENFEDVGLRLEIRSKKTGKTEVFEIKKSTKYVFETSVTKL